MAAGVGAAGVNYDMFGSGGGSDLSGLIQAQGMAAAASQPLDGFFIPGSSSSLMGTGSSMVSFKDACGGGKRNERQFMRAYDYWDENGDDEFDDYFQQPDQKKRRLTAEQVRFLEKSFEVENKLEPERKVQLAKDLGLQPRQVAIWFQNRRARWKNKQLEKDFETLQTSFDSLKADYDHLLREKDRLKAEVVYLSDKLQVKEKLDGAGGVGESETSDSENQLLQASSQEEPVVYYTASSEEGSPRAASSSMVPEDLPSMPELDYRAGFEAKSPTPYADRCQLMAGLLLSSDPIAYGFEQPRDCSEVSQDNPNSAAQENLLPCSSYNNDDNNGFVASVDYGDHDATANSSQFGIPGTCQEGDHPPWIWSY